MWRILAILALLVSSALAGSSLWLLIHPTATPLLVPGATDIRVVITGW